MCCAVVLLACWTTLLWPGCQLPHPSTSHCAAAGAGRGSVCCLACCAACCAACWGGRQPAGCAGAGAGSGSGNRPDARGLFRDHTEPAREAELALGALGRPLPLASRLGRCAPAGRALRQHWNMPRLLLCLALSAGRACRPGCVRAAPAACASVLCSVSRPCLTAGLCAGKPQPAPLRRAAGPGAGLCRIAIRHHGGVRRLWQLQQAEAKAGAGRAACWPCCAAGHPPAQGLDTVASPSSTMAAYSGSGSSSGLRSKLRVWSDTCVRQRTAIRQRAGHLGQGSS